MLDKSLSLSELSELINSGADVDIARKPLVVEQFSELIDKLNQMIASNEERAKADLARSQTQLEVLAALQALIRKDQGVKLSPQVGVSEIKEILTQLANTQQRPRVTYEFDVQRSAQGYISSIIAKPLGQTMH